MKKINDFYPEEMIESLVYLAEGDVSLIDEYGNIREDVDMMKEALYRISTRADYNDNFKTFWNLLQKICDREKYNKIIIDED